jgi:GH25 family lysozyme M1 (1,4-beta-N-acetylmuramidase)
MSPRHLRRGVCAVLLGLALGATSAVLPADRASAAPVSPRPVPTDRAARAGVEPGNAPMGWAHRGSSAARSADSGLATAPAAVTGVLGIDVSSHQGRVNWAGYKRQGKVFAYVKATEGTSYRNPYFTSQYNGSAAAGFIRGAYHFANPAGASGAAQADYFWRNGGRWLRDGKTLPGVLDIEYNPYGSTCYGLSPTSMVNWIAAFAARYKLRTGRDVVIYTTYDWWRRCTGNTTRFSRTNPLWLARHASTPGTRPGGWPFYTFWQYSSTPIDQNRFSASYARLKALANG